MTDLAIRAEKLGKQYRIGVARARYGSLREDLMSALAAPFRRLRGLARRCNSPTSRDSGEVRPVPESFIWALRDASFEIKHGEVVGIIGRNGAGKSTLLKVLSRITEPTEGCAEVWGRIGSLLEVGTGFHPELTGRENTYLNGAILGMGKAEIDRKFDEIVSFAGVEKFIDTPVKHFSSGMHVRLAFAVAAHLESEILLVDEVLAVGDAEFQQKCLGKMQSVANTGRTVLLVSHNMAAIRNLCKRALLLHYGKIIADGPPDLVISKYLDRNLQEGAVISGSEIDRMLEGFILRSQPTIRIKELAIVDARGLPRSEFQSEEEVRVCITYECFTTITGLHAVVHVVSQDDIPILISQNHDDSASSQFYRIEPGTYKSVCAIPANLLGERRYFVKVELIYPKVEHLVLNKVLSFGVRFNGYNNEFDWRFEQAWVRPCLRWQTEQLDGRRS
jgi:lipopolysaccharide transport system ATP-binding protein